MPVDPTIFGATGFAFPVISASADYPAVGDVEAGVAYNFGALVGTFAVPAAGDVRTGVGYGAGGTEFTGTLYVPVAPGPNKLLARLQQIVRQIPDLVTVGYEPRLAGDNYGPSVQFAARRLPLLSADAGGLSQRTCVWALYATAGQVVRPARLGRITDPNGIKYDVYSAELGFGDYHAVCHCTQEVH